MKYYYRICIKIVWINWQNCQTPENAYHYINFHNNILLLSAKKHSNNGFNLMFML